MTVPEPETIVGRLAAVDSVPAAVPQVPASAGAMLGCLPEVAAELVTGAF
jgi:hypothetical protein